MRSTNSGARRFRFDAVVANQKSSGRSLQRGVIPVGFDQYHGAIPVTNAQRRAAWLASRKAEMDSSSNDSKPEPMPRPTPSSAFCPHEAGAYYLAAVNTVGTFKMFARDLKPPVYTYGITTVRFELDFDAGKRVCFDGERNLSPRKIQYCWHLATRRLNVTREGA